LDIIVWVVYYGQLDGIRQQTVGKRMMGIRVVDANTGGPIGFGRAVLRMFILGISLIPCLIGAFSPFFDGTKRNQGWHDKVGNDLVVKAG
jgi:uncharacterized RDD family membrane protein YckC